MKINTIDGISSSDIDTYITPVTPISQPGTFGAIEPAMTNIGPGFTVPSYEYKWNQVVEVQLPDRKKVSF